MIYNRIMRFVGNAAFLHIKCQVRGRNEHDDFEDSLCEIIMKKTGMHVP